MFSGVCKGVILYRLSQKGVRVRSMDLFALRGGERSIFSYIANDAIPLLGN
jgi:hypothetical protein